VLLSATSVSTPLSIFLHGERNARMRGRKAKSFTPSASSSKGKNNLVSKRNLLVNFSSHLPQQPRQRNANLLPQGFRRVPATDLGMEESEESTGRIWRGHCSVHALWEGMTMDRPGQSVKTSQAKRTQGPCCYSKAGTHSLSRTTHRRNGQNAYATRGDHLLVVNRTWRPSRQVQLGRILPRSLRTRSVLTETNSCTTERQSHLTHQPPWAAAALS
jgi:hypothetical protein